MDRSDSFPAARSVAPTRVPPWAAALVLVVAFVGLVAALQGAVLVVAAVTGARVDEAQRIAAHTPLVLGLAQLVGLAPSLALAARLRAPSVCGFVDDAAPRVSLLALVGAAALGVGLQLPLVELGTRLGAWFPALAEDAATEERLRAALAVDSPAALLGVVASVVVIAPITEELLFRGFALPTLLDAARGPLGRGVARVVVALGFALFHASLASFVPIAVAGLVLGEVALRARSIRASVALHAAFNATPVVLSWSGLDDVVTGGPDASNVTSWALALSLVAAAVGAALFHRAAPASR